MATKKKTSVSHTDPDGLSVRERNFVERILSGEQGGPAYLAAGFKASTPGSAKACASRLLAKPHIKDVIAREREKARTSATIQREELIAYLANVIRTPIGKIDENSPLMQSYTRTEGELGTTVRFQMVSKMDSIKHLTFLLGYDPPKKQEISVPNDLHSLLLNLRSGYSPS